MFTELPSAYSIDVAVAHRWFVGGWLQTRSPEVREKTTPAVNNGRGLGDGLIADMTPDAAVQLWYPALDPDGLS